MFNYEKALQALKNYKIVFSSMKDIFKNLLADYKANNTHQKIFKYFKTNLNCPHIYLEDSYMFMGKYHLEIFPFSGAFIKSSHRLLDIFPHTVALDNDLESLKTLEVTLEGSFCPIETIQQDPINTPFSSDFNFDSIALNFALDKINGNMDKIEEFLISFKNKLNDGGTIFGVTTAGLGISHKKNALNYIEKQNNDHIWFNKDRNIEDLENLFDKHFDEVSTGISGSCLIFRLGLKKKHPDLTPHRNHFIANIEGKYLEVNPK